MTCPRAPPNLQRPRISLQPAPLVSAKFFVFQQLQPTRDLSALNINSMPYLSGKNMKEGVVLFRVITKELSTNQAYLRNKGSIYLSGSCAWPLRAQVHKLEAIFCFPQRTAASTKEGNEPILRTLVKNICRSDSVCILASPLYAHLRAPLHA